MRLPTIHKPLVSACLPGAAISLGQGLRAVFVESTLRSGAEAAGAGVVNFRPACTVPRTGACASELLWPPLSLLARGVGVAHSRGGTDGSQVWRQDDLSCWDISGPKEGLGILANFPHGATIKWQKAAFQRLHPKSPATVIKPQRHSCFLPSRLLLCHPTPPPTSCHSTGAVCGLPLHLLSMPHLGPFSVWFPPK